MKQVFLVTAGEYSDYHICQVFSTKDKAQQYCEVMGLSDDDIEEYELDMGGFEIKGLKPYFVRMKRNGDTEEVYEDKSTYSGGFGFDCNGSLHINCWAKDEQHAVKIANEKRTYLIANNKWK